jgi:hypothetical protein
MFCVNDEGGRRERNRKRKRGREREREREREEKEREGCGPGIIGCYLQEIREAEQDIE